MKLDNTLTHWFTVFQGIKFVNFMIDEIQCICGKPEFSTSTNYMITIVCNQQHWPDNYHGNQSPFTKSRSGYVKFCSTHGGQHSPSSKVTFLQ